MQGIFVADESCPFKIVLLKNENEVKIFFLLTKVLYASNCFLCITFNQVDYKKKCQSV